MEFDHNESGIIEAEQIIIKQGGLITHHKDLFWVTYLGDDPDAIEAVKFLLGEWENYFSPKNEAKKIDAVVNSIVQEFPDLSEDQDTMQYEWVRHLRDIASVLRRYD